jgi:hypothetical protein
MAALVPHGGGGGELKAAASTKIGRLAGAADQ